MDVTEGEESPRPPEPEPVFQRDGVWLAAERTSRLATRKEPKVEGSPIMDDRANDGRGARMTSEGGGHGRRLRRRRVKLEGRSLKAERFSNPMDQAAAARSREFAEQPSGPRSPRQRRPRKRQRQRMKVEVGRENAEAIDAKQPNDCRVGRSVEGGPNVNDPPQREGAFPFWASVLPAEL